MFPGSATALRFHFLVAVMQLKANNREVNRWSCYGHRSGILEVDDRSMQSGYLYTSTARMTVNN